MLREETKNDYKVKFDKFKAWVKENGFALSRIMIGIGGIIAVVTTSLRTGVQAVARGTYGLGKGIVKILSKLGPIIQCIGKCSNVNPEHWFASSDVAVE